MDAALAVGVTAVVVYGVYRLANSAHELSMFALKAAIIATF